MPSVEECPYCAADVFVTTIAGWPSDGSGGLGRVLHEGTCGAPCYGSAEVRRKDEGAHPFDCACPAPAVEPRRRRSKNGHIGDEIRRFRFERDRQAEQERKLRELAP